MAPGLPPAVLEDCRETAEAPALFVIYRLISEVWAGLGCVVAAGYGAAYAVVVAGPKVIFTLLMSGLALLLAVAC